jgi:hypothetical protein
LPSNQALSAGHGLASGDDGADQAGGDVLLADPGVQVGVVDQGGRHHVGVGLGHHTRHIAAHALELFRLAAGLHARRGGAYRLAGQRHGRARRRRAGLRQFRRQMAAGGGGHGGARGGDAERGRAVGGGGLHVLHGDHAVGAGRAHTGEIDLELLGQCAHRWHRLHAAGAADLLDVHGVAADHRADHGAFVFAIGLGFHFAAFVGSDHLAGVRGRTAHALLGAVVVAGGFGLGALLGVRIGFEVSQRGAGLDDVARRAVELLDRAGVGRRHIDHRLGGFHRAQRCVELDVVAFFHVPLDDGGVGQAFAEVGQVECLDVGHECEVRSA